MTKIDKLYTAAGNDWRTVTSDGMVIFYREEAGDGYPHAINVRVTEDGDVLDGDLYTSYGEEVEEFTIGSRAITGVLSNLHNPFKYKTFYDAFLATEPESISEKVMGDKAKLSERQVRNARILGWMNGYVADKLCVKLLGYCPINLYGYEAWCEYEGKDAWPKTKADA